MSMYLEHELNRPAAFCLVIRRAFAEACVSSRGCQAIGVFAPFSPILVLPLCYLHTYEDKGWLGTAVT